jgi:hypothetical protein
MFGPLALAATLSLFVLGCRSSEAMTSPTCAPGAQPNATFNGPFSVDTGVAPSTVGAGYGQASCPDQFLVDIDLTASAFAGHDLFVTGRWSLALPTTPCDEQATMAVYTFDGRAWTTWDVVTYVGQGSGSICHAQAQTHTDVAAAGLGGASIPASRGFQRARVAVAARHQNGDKVAVYVTGQSP